MGGVSINESQESCKDSLYSTDTLEDYYTTDSLKDTGDTVMKKKFLPFRILYSSGVQVS